MIISKWRVCHPDGSFVEFNKADYPQSAAITWRDNNWPTATITTVDETLQDPQP